MESLTLEPLVHTIALILIFNFPHFYGAAENRLFKEHGEYLPGKHFRIYHLWLAGLFACSGFFVYVLSGSFWLAGCYLAYAPFGLDWVWWAIRYFDFNRDPIKARYSYHEDNALPLQTDWDNYLGLPLVMGYYWWWYVTGTLSVAMGGLSLIA